jgi:hypothetical protein
MRLFLLIISLSFRLLSEAQKAYPDFENYSGEKIVLEENVLIVVVKDSYCSLCFEQLKEIFNARFLKKTNKIYLLIDGTILRHDMPYYAFQISQKMCFPITAEEVLFKVNPESSLQLKPLYDDISQSPYLLLVQKDTCAMISNHHLFEEHLPPKKIREEITLFFER